MEIIERYTNPSKHVQAPYGTLCRNGEKFFIQVSKDTDTPKWVSMGNMLAFCYKDRFILDDFICDLLDAYELKNVQPGSTSSLSFDVDGDSL